MTIHWSRPIAAVFLVQLSMTALVFSVLEKIVELWNSQLSNTIHQKDV